MKKLVIFAAAAIATLAACSKLGPDSGKQSNRAIHFSAVTGKTTKALITGTYYGTDAPVFGMFTYALASGQNWNVDHGDGQLYMNNVQIKYNEGSDIWEPWSGSSFVTYYWPLSGSLTFVGYSPYKESGVTYDNATHALTFTDFTVATSAAAYGTANLAIPQTLDAQKFAITYSLAKGTVDLGSKTVEVALKNDAITAWSNNTKYLYNITIDLNKIYFNPAIEDWTSTAVEAGVNVH